MPRKKLQSTALRPGKAESDETLNLTSLPPSKMVVYLPEHAGGLRNLNFAKHYGNSCDVVVYAAQRAIDIMATACTESGGKTLSATTIAGYYSRGLAAFLPFCTIMASALGRDLQLNDIDRQFIDHFIAHLRQSGVSIGSQKGLYTAAKSVLVAMGQSGWIAKNIFPRNPYPNADRSLKGQPPLSEPERRSVLGALKADMRAIMKGSEPLTSDELVVCLLAIAARTGINPTPALELLTDCLQPHPIKQDRYMLVSFKRRGNGTHIQSLRRAVDVESIVSALPDVARIIDLVRERNAKPRQASNYPECLFVYESRGWANTGEMCRLNQRSLPSSIKVFLDRHQITNADGKALKLNFMRLRKTFENRLFTLSGQDPFLTARLGGHTVKISDNHYLEAPESAEKDWRLMGEVRTEELLSHNKLAPLTTQNTPVARCQDTLNGHHAPKNGEHCQKFLACFRCRSFVVTGDDLYRVFSLYWALVQMRQTMGSSAWKRIYGHIIRIIDQEVTPQFDAELVSIQRQYAKVDPHPFWRDPERLGDIA
ncbi:phage integrase SAM-like domain-containing protein [Vreelandella titanicae]|uniref:phage integrase SAM-like domain-containing protein n=1 Tax=Vreelandella titanicae TaxID=664683 RepID=UPI0039BF2090